MLHGHNKQDLISQLDTIKEKLNKDLKVDKDALSHSYNNG